MRIKNVGLAVAAALLFLLPLELCAQEGLAGQSLRGYTHMFIAYFIVWALVLGWVVSIALRLGRIEKSLKR